jgi:hypothetical protein
MIKIKVSGYYGLIADGVIGKKTDKKIKLNIPSNQALAFF